MTTLVLGMGNPILSDDGLGLVVARRLRGLPMPQDVEVAESEVGGLRLLELVRGFTKVVIIDALQSGGTPGEIKRINADEFRGGHRYGSAHSIHLGTVLELGRQLGSPCRPRWSSTRSKRSTSRPSASSSPRQWPRPPSGSSG